MNKRILKYKIGDLCSNNEEVCNDPEIKNMEIEDFISKGIQKRISKKQKKIISKALAKYNLDINMTRIDIEIFKVNRYSIFITQKLDTLFPDDILNKLKKMNICTLSSVVAINENEDSIFFKKGRIKRIPNDMLERIKTILNRLGLHLSMTKEEMLAMAENEKKDYLNGDPRKILQMPIDYFLELPEINLKFKTDFYENKSESDIRTVKDFIKNSTWYIELYIRLWCKSIYYDEYYEHDPALKFDVEYLDNIMLTIEEKLKEYGLRLEMSEFEIKIYKENPKSILLKRISDEIPEFDKIIKLLEERKIFYVYQLPNCSDIEQVKTYLESKGLPTIYDENELLSYAKRENKTVESKYAYKFNPNASNNGPNNSPTQTATRLHP